MKLSRDRERAFDEIEKKLTELEALIKQTSLDGSKKELISIVDKGDKTFSVKFRTSKGFIESDSSQATGFKFTGD